ncbi:MAG: hypothetical protein ABW168_08175 [Sedimenticola sp.]
MPCLPPFNRTWLLLWAALLSVPATAMQPLSEVTAYLKARIETDEQILQPLADQIGVMGVCQTLVRADPVLPGVVLYEVRIDCELQVGPGSFTTRIQARGVGRNPSTAHTDGLLQVADQLHRQFHDHLLEASRRQQSDDLIRRISQLDRQIEQVRQDDWLERNSQLLEHLSGDSK